ncbi:MAG: response regulator transcription factor [Phycisphaerae bacterium]|nr:response regulator transcription factor [Saprospiraceae bacterium]
MTKHPKLSSYQSGNKFPDENPKLHSERILSPRECEIIQGLSNDQNVKMIASKLHISPFTVQDHIKHIKCKMQVHTPGGIVAQALREGWIV